MPTVQTVLGPIDAADMGITMSGVHLTIDVSCYYVAPEDPEERAYVEGPITLEKLGEVRRNGLRFRSNIVMDDVDEAIEEVSAFARAGGRTIVNMDLEGMGRDPAALQRIARETGLQIVASTGFYNESTHPPQLADWSVEQVADHFVREIEEGIGDTGIRCGNIGKLGCSGPPELACLPGEEKVLRAAARAQARTGVSLAVHPNIGGPPSRGAPPDHFATYVDLLVDEGADLGRVHFSHMGTYPLDNALYLLERGVGFLAYDQFGHEEYYEIMGPGRAFPRDKDEIELVMSLLERGFEDRLLITCEVGWKTCYKRYGGWGYDHVLVHVVPWLLDCGASKAQIDKLTRTNAARLHAL